MNINVLNRAVCVAALLALAYLVACHDAEVVDNDGDGLTAWVECNDNDPNDTRDCSYCGDGYVDRLEPYNEECDDGNNNNYDSCDNICLLASSPVEEEDVGIDMGSDLGTDLGGGEDAPAGEDADAGEEACNGGTECTSDGDCLSDQVCEAGCCVDDTNPGTCDDPCCADTDGDGMADTLVDENTVLCNGDEPVYCLTSEIGVLTNVFVNGTRLDCGVLGFDCGYIDEPYSEDGFSYEAYCLPSDTGDCFGESTSGSREGYAYCPGDGMACLWTLADPGGVCTAGYESCADMELDTCIGSMYLLECTLGQPAGFDCGSTGGQCDTSGQSWCRNIPEGGDCKEGELTCNPAYICTGETDTSPGTCAPMT